MQQHDLRITTKLCEDVSDGRIDHQSARDTLLDHLDITMDEATPQMNWARTHFDPTKELVSLTWAPMTQLEATIKAHELHTQRRSRYRNRKAS